MSTKTTFKRVALIAVASLGLGVLTSVAPANAAVIVTGDIAVTGTASGDAAIIAGTAGTVTSTVTTATPVTFAWQVTDPAGNASVIGTDVANATVGTVSAIAAKASTLTFATTFLTAAKAGKWTVKAVAQDTAATSLDSAAEITAAVGVAANTTSTNFFVYASTPTYVGGKGRSVTSATEISQDANGTATVFVVADTASTSYSATTTGVGSIQSAYASNAGWTSTTALTASTTDTVTNNNGTTPAGGVTWVPTVKKGVLQLKVSSSVAGTTTVSVTAQDANGIPGTPVKATITWGAAPAATAVTAILASGTGGTYTGTSASSVYLSKTSGAGAAQASIALTVKDQTGATINGVPLDVTVSGPGLVSITSGNTTPNTTATAGTTRTASLSASAQASTPYAIVGITADGTAGTGTVTVSTGTTVLTTATIYFYGAAASVSATQVLKIASSSGGTLGGTGVALSGADVLNTPSVIVSVKDANGVLIPGLTTANIKADSSDVAVMTTDLVVAESDGNGASNTTAKTYNVQVKSSANTSGKSATLTFKVLGSDGVTFVTSAPIKFTLGGSVATVALSLDKASYSIGSAAVATLTAKDSSGNAAKDGVLATTLEAALTSSYSVNKTLFGASVDFIGGVATVSFNAPVITGAWTISGTTGTGPSTDKAKALTASATVTGGNDAAIASLISKINALSKLIAKIQKKLGIK